MIHSLYEGLKIGLEIFGVCVGLLIPLAVIMSAIATHGQLQMIWDRKRKNASK